MLRILLLILLFIFAQTAEAKQARPLGAASCQWKPASCPGPKPNLPRGRMT